VPALRGKAPPAEPAISAMGESQSAPLRRVLVDTSASMALQHTVARCAATKPRKTGSAGRLATDGP
jgi:hypothetical protein